MLGCTVKAPLVNTCVLWSVFDLNHMKHTVDCFVNIRRHKVITYCHAHVQGSIFYYYGLNNWRFVIWQFYSSVFSSSYFPAKYLLSDLSSSLGPGPILSNILRQCRGSINYLAHLAFIILLSIYYLMYLIKGKFSSE